MNSYGDYLYGDNKPEEAIEEYVILLRWIISIIDNHHHH